MGCMARNGGDKEVALSPEIFDSICAMAAKAVMQDDNFL